MSAAAPGQASAAVEPWRAAWMAFREAAGFDYADDRAPDDELDAQWIAAWTAAAQAVLNQAFPGLRKQADEAKGQVRQLRTLVREICRFAENDLAGNIGIRPSDIRSWRDRAGIEP